MAECTAGFVGWAGGDLEWVGSIAKAARFGASARLGNVAYESQRVLRALQRSKAVRSASLFSAVSHLTCVPCRHHPRARLLHKRPHPAALSFNDRLRPPHHDPSLSLLLHPPLGLGRISAMSFLDTIQNAAMKVLPEKKSSLPMHSSNAGIASGGHVPFEDDVSLPFPHLPFISRTRGPRPLASFLPRPTCLVGAIVPVFIPCPPVARSPSLCRP